MKDEFSKDSVLEIEALSHSLEIDTKGGRQIWHVWNKGGKEKVVLFHGGSGSWTHWVRNIKHLSMTREVWALDIPGFGDSELPAGALDVDDLAPFVYEGMQKIGGANSLDVIGFSFGGLLAGYVAANDPDSIRKLILVGVPALGLTGSPLPLRGLRPDMTPTEVNGVHHHNLKIMMLANEYMIEADTVELQRKNIERDRLKRRRIARSGVLLELQKKWTCQVFGVWGELDALYKGHMHDIEARLENCNLQNFKVIPSAGHWVQYEQADAFNDHVLKILNDCIEQ